MVDFFIPNKYRLRPEKLRKSRIVVFVHFLAALIGIGHCLATPISQLGTYSILGVFLVIPALFIFKKYGSFVLSGNLFIVVLYLFLFRSSVDTGYLYSDDILWMITLPIMGFFLSGRFSGVFWTVVFIGTLINAYFTEVNAEESFFKDSLVLDPQFYFNSILFLSLVIISFLFIFDYESYVLLKDLKKHRTTLKEQNLLLEAKVKERTQTLRKMNNQLKSSNSDLEQFAYVASHDLQEPLRMVGNFVELLEVDYGDKLDEDGKMYIEYAVRGVSRMSRLIEELLQYSRVGRKGNDTAIVDMNEVLDVKLQDIAFTIQEKNVKFDIGYLPTRIRCYPNQISILLQNLITNGIKFNESEQPVITIKGEEHKDHWQFMVADNGIGIDKEYEKRIFEVFKRLHSKEEYPGTGIGLAICKKVVDGHNGDIWIESEKGKGTAFYFTVSKYLN